MRACDRCLENDWSFEYQDGYITVTCNQCGHEVQFKARER